MSQADFAIWLKRWGLTPDGEPFVTRYTGSCLLPVRQDKTPAMLKVAKAPEEIRGAALMDWWAGDGAAPVLAREGPALLLERATSADGLVAMSRDGQDEAALDIVCATVSRLHAARAKRSPEVVPLDRWFRSLEDMAGRDERLARARNVARTLLAKPRDVVVLHGDIHHANILDFGPRGWLAIDPKGLIGERAYDFANTFRNPDLATALVPGRIAARQAYVARATGVDLARLKAWTVAHAALSVAWSIEDGKAPGDGLAILDAALAEQAP